MKIITPLVFFLLFTTMYSCSLRTDSFKNDLRKENLNGDVSLVVEEFQDESNKSLIIKEFDKDGYLVKEFSSNNSNSTLYEYNYNDKKLINRNSIQINGDKKNYEKTLYEYSEDGKLLKETIIYDNKQRIIEYIYNGEKLDKKLQDKSTTTNYYYSVYLDSTKTEHTPTLIDGEEQQTIVVNCFNEKGLKIKEIVRNCYLLKCDSFVILSKYDIYGNMINSVIQGETDSLFISYTYDNKQNWILKNATRGDKIEYSSTRKVLYLGDDISNYLKVIEEFKRNSSIVGSNENLEAKQNPQTYTSNDIENSSNQSGLCSECNGTGKCRGCNRVFQKPYLKNGYYQKISETKVGYTLCNLCIGKGFKDKNIGSGYEIIGDCSSYKCQDGWEGCYLCNPSGQRNNIGQCVKCRGTGRK